MHVQLVALSSAFDGDGLQSLLQTPGVKLPRRGESQISLIKSAHDLTSWQEEAAVAPCALGRYRPGAGPQVAGRRWSSVSESSYV